MDGSTYKNTPTKLNILEQEVKQYSGNAFSRTREFNKINLRLI